jgi:hypothetical protein
VATFSEFSFVFGCLVTSSVQHLFKSRSILASSTARLGSKIGIKPFWFYFLPGLRSTGLFASLSVFARWRIRGMPSIVEPAFEFLKSIINLAQNPFDCSDRGIAYCCSIEKQDKSGEVARYQKQLINMLDLNRNKSHRRFIGALIIMRCCVKPWDTSPFDCL